MGVGPNYGLDKGFLATGGVAYAYGDPVVQNADGLSVAQASAAGVSCVGVCQENIIADNVKTGKAIINIRLTGVSRVTASAVIAVNDLVANTADKRVAKATAGQFVLGRALMPAKAAGDIIEILLTPGVKA